ILSIINTFLTKSTRQGVFATMSIIKLSPQADTVEYASAAHLPAIIIESDATIKKLDTAGLPLGLETSSNYHNIKKELSPGTTIILYTDGITEATNINSTALGENGLIKMLQKHRHLDAENMIKQIEEEIENYTQNTMLSDDQTLLLIKNRKTQ
ncbi:PP2C family protein-serine/threonine phosphatase, partial [Spirochaetia bacterium 38H-sp]